MDIYGLIGKTLKHSWSKNWFNKYFEDNQIDAKYLNFELDSTNEIYDLIQKYPRLKGLNVTIPFKQQIIPALDNISVVASEIGAVNTIKILRDNARITLFGDNTDIVGFQKTIDLINKSIDNALVLGNGGASRAVCFVLTQNNIDYKIVSRSNGDLLYEELSDDIISRFNLIVNTTPVGMFPNVNCAPKIPYSVLSKKHILIDLIYNPVETLFMRKGKLAGSEVLNGETMLIGQARASYKIWKF